MGGRQRKGGDGTEAAERREVTEWRWQEVGETSKGGEGARMGEMGGTAVIGGRDGVLRVLLSVGVLRAFKRLVRGWR